jgi:hypothetical protein
MILLRLTRVSERLRIDLGRLFGLANQVKSSYGEGQRALLKSMVPQGLDHSRVSSLRVLDIPYG